MIITDKNMHIYIYIMNKENGVRIEGGTSTFPLGVPYHGFDELTFTVP